MLTFTSFIGLLSECCDICYDRSMRMLKTNNFYLRSSIFSMLSVLGSAFGFLLYPVLARILTLQEFGDFSGIIALANQSVGFLAALNIISLFLVKTHTEDVAREKAQMIQKVLLRIFAVFSAVLILLSPLLKRLLHIESSFGFVIFAVLLLLAIVTSVWVGFIQGHKEFVRIGIYNFCAALSKFVLALVGAYAFGLPGALMGFTLSGVAGLIILRMLPGKRPPSVFTALTRVKKEETALVKKMLPQIGSAVFVVGSIGYLQNFDLTLSKILFTPSIAGAYSGIGFMSNALYFILILIVWIVLPEIDDKNPKATKRVMSTAVKLFAAITTASCLGVFVLRGNITSILLGKDFANLGNVLLFSLLYQASLALLALGSFYMLLLKRLRVVVLCGMVLLSSLTIPGLIADSPQEMITALWLCVTLSGALFWLFERLRKYV